MTPAEEVAIAKQASAWMARRVTACADYHEFLGAAWLRVRRERDRHPDAGRRLLSTAARLAAWDDARDLHQWRRRGPRREESQDALDALNEAIQPDNVPPVEHRLLILWGESRERRRHAGILARVWAYLWLVEGWTQQSIAATWGLTGSAVTATIHREGLSGRPVVPRKRSGPGLVRALTTGQQEAVRREFAARGTVGSQAWIRDTAARLGVGHATIRRTVYRCGASRRPAVTIR